MSSILVVDDDASAVKYMSLTLGDAGHAVRTAGNGVEALLAIEDGVPDLVVTDLQMPELDGMGLLARIRQRWPDLPVIVVSVQEEVATVVEAVHRGALNYLLKPCSPESIEQAVGKALVRREPRPGGEDATASEILGRSRAIVEVRHLVALAARADVNILVSGETGTGKEIVSRAVHRRSKLADKPFVAHNCAATPPELFESQFFGYRKGAFTGAARDQIGLLESADGGVLLLDELGSMSIQHQAKLLRVMDDGEVRRVGDNETRRVSVRYIAAVNRPPGELIGAGKLREDLYFRVRGIEFFLPPLRERPEDVGVFADHFLGKGPLGFTPAAMDYLRTYDWPGNVRELKNAVLSAAAFAGDDRIDVRHLQAVLRRGEDAAPVAPRGPVTGTLKEVEQEAIRAALATYGNNRSLAARSLGIDRSTLRRKLAAMGEGDRANDPPGKS